MTHEDRVITFMFGYAFDSEDIDRIARASGVEPDELTALQLTAWVQDLITTELMSPDPLKEGEDDELEDDELEDDELEAASTTRCRNCSRNTYVLGEGCPACHWLDDEIEADA